MRYLNILYLQGTKLVLSKDEVEEFVFNIHMLEVIEMHIDTYNEPLEIKEPNE